MSVVDERMTGLDLVSVVRADYRTRSGVCGERGLQD